ncbi:uncharacterized protein V1518DRAFT_371827 [Limtongia smithiae]|uniref:uncharacterized protein n=1 Tax=Limtongia smithiae TaxID=1125753 RepID=UPI0034CD0409
MPLPGLPGWVASQIGLGVANAIVVGYRSYERVHFIIKKKVKKISNVFVSAVKGREEGAGADGTLAATTSDAMRGSTANLTTAASRNSTFGTALRASDSGDSPPPSNIFTRREADKEIKTLLEDTPSIAIFFLKPEPHTDRRIIHVYNNQGEKVYVLLRPSAHSDTWTLSYEDGSGDLATIYAGAKDGYGVGTGIIAARARPGKYILFNNPHGGGGLTYRKVSKHWTPQEGTLRTFYLSGAAPYSWNKYGLLQRKIFMAQEYLFTDPAVGSPALVPMPRMRRSVSNATISRPAGPALSANTSPLLRRSSGASPPASPRINIPSRTISVSSVPMSYAPSLQSMSTASRHSAPSSSRATSAAALIDALTVRETIAHASKISKEMTWRIAIDTDKISPEIVIATAWISILTQWGTKITSFGVKLPDNIS